jgi:heme/copper-type cytochrome/quinol oxidase subunit 2
LVKIKKGVIKIMWWYLIPILIFSVVALMSYRSGKELKEDIRKYKLTK